MGLRFPRKWSLARTNESNTRRIAVTIHIGGMKLKKEASLVEGTISKIQGLMSNNGALPFVLFSGGKDSLVTLDLVNRASERLQRKPIAIHADTTVSLPCNIEYVKNICGQLKVEPVIVRPRASYFELAERWGLPRFRAR